MSKVKSIFELPEFKPYEKAWNTRVKTLSKRASYYDGSIYNENKKDLGWLMPRLYRGIKPLYLPLASAVDVDCGIIPGDWKLPEEDSRTEGWQNAIDTVFDWSNWDTDGVLYVHYGAQYGVSGLRVADLRDIQKVIVQPIDPTLYMPIGMSAYDNKPDMSIMIETRQDTSGDDFQYAEVITPQQIRTFKAGEPFGFDGRDAEYGNEQGFVPFVEIRHIETGKPFGECTFQKAIPLLDEVNEMASYLADIIKKNVEPQWFARGIEPSDLTQSGDNVWFATSPDSDMRPLVPGIDIDGVLAFVKEIAANVDRALPERAFDDIRRKDQIATATLELQLMELVLKIKRVRPNYDKGLKQALQMAGKAAKTMGLSEIAVLDDEELRFDDQRPILPVDEESQMKLEMTRLELEIMRNSVRNSAITEGADA